MHLPEWQEYLEPAKEAIDRFRQTLEETPAIPAVTADQIRAHLQATYSFEEPIGPNALVQDVAQMMQEWNLHTPSPNYFGLYNPDVVPATIAADALVAGFNPQLAAWSHAPAANEIERHALGYIAHLAGYDKSQAEGCFTSGGLEANQSAVIVALTKQFPQFRNDGARACTGRPAIYVSVEAHHSFVKIAHACGLGRASVREIAVDRDLRMDVSVLARQIAQDKAGGWAPFAVVATAGTTSAGAIDPLIEIAELCRQEGLWLHVDAAWGGGALLSDRLRPLLTGIHRADSITFDAHKWLSVPMGAGMFLCKQESDMVAAFGIETSYMPARSQSPDPYHSTLQWSRRFIGLKVFMALASLGRDGYALQIEHQASMADLMATALTEAGWRVQIHSPLAVVCFTHPRLDSGGVSHRDVLAKLYESRRSWASITCLSHHGELFRACVTNYRTEPQHVRLLVSSMSAALEAASVARSGA